MSGHTHTHNKKKKSAEESYKASGQYFRQKDRNKRASAMKKNKTSKKLL